MKKIELYTDGACRGNPGPGAWAALLRFGQSERMLSGAEPETTNNRMELSAVIHGFEALNEACEVEVFTDSQYVLKGMTQWVEGWQKRGWKTASNKAVANVELWQRLLSAAQGHQLNWHWVKGHSGHIENERVDAQCNVEMDQMLGAN